jgi:hypothetical protein
MSKDGVYIEARNLVDEMDDRLAKLERAVGI